MHCICLSQDQTIPVSTHNCCAAVEIRLSRKLRRDKWYVEMVNFVWRRRQEAGKAEPFVCKVVSVGSCCNRRPRFSACDQWHQWPPISPPAQDSHFRVALSLQLSCLWPTAGVMLCPFLNLRPQGVPLRTSQGTLLHWDLAILLQRSMEQPVESQWGRADERPRVWVTWEVRVESTFTDSSTLETHPYVLINSQTRMSYSHSCAFHPSACAQPVLLHLVTHNTYTIAIYTSSANRAHTHPPYSPIPTHPLTHSLLPHSQSLTNELIHCSLIHAPSATQASSHSVYTYALLFTRAHKVSVIHTYSHPILSRMVSAIHTHTTHIPIISTISTLTHRPQWLAFTAHT